MDNFETPSWDVEKETEKWASDLFASSNIKRSKVPKKRKRNKYPKGFGKTRSSETVEESKDESTSGANYLNPENSDKYSSDISPPKGKRKKKSSEKYDTEKGACDSASKIGKVSGNSIVKDASRSTSKPSALKLSLKKKRKSKPSLDVFESSSPKDGGVNEKSVVDDSFSTNFKPTVSTAPKLNSKKKKNKSNLVNVNESSSAKCKEVCENSMDVDSLSTNSQERLSTTPKLNPKKKKRKSNLVNVDESSSAKCKEVSENSSTNSQERLSMTPKLSSKKKKKKRKSNLVNVDESSSAKCKIVSENSTDVDNLSTNSQERLSMTPKLSLKKNKKKKSSSGESKKKQIKALNNLKTLQNQLNLSADLIGEGIEHFNENSGGESKNKIKKSKKLNKTAERSQVVTDEDEQSEDDDTGRYSEPGNVVGRKRKHCEEEVISKKKRKKSRKAGKKSTEQDIPEDGEIQIFSGHTNEDSLEKREASFQGGEMKKSYPPDASASPGIKKKKLSLREKMEEKLRGARFRFLNEQLYTSKSKDTNNFFLLDRKAFEAYHEGYKQQLMQWPVKPVDLIIKSLMKKPSSYVIADFGCGDAKLAQSLPNKVHSFDHVALNNHVTVCDMAHTPLTKGSVDVVVFCLSLMGSNLSDYISEANRVLKIGGLLKIAEVESRFDDVNNFVKLVSKFGFLRIHQDSSNDYFYLFDFRKEKNLKEGKALPSIELRVCYYKKR